MLTAGIAEDCVPWQPAAEVRSPAVAELSRIAELEAGHARIEEIIRNTHAAREYQQTRVRILMALRPELDRLAAAKELGVSQATAYRVPKPKRDPE